jgi:hypothetical protein
MSTFVVLREKVRAVRNVWDIDGISAAVVCSDASSKTMYEKLNQENSIPQAPKNCRRTSVATTA